MVKQYDAGVSVGEILKDFSRVDILQGNFIDSTAVSASGTAKIKHGLGREPKGWVVVDADADATFYRDSSNPRPRAELWLVNASSNAVNIKVWVF